MKQLMATSLQDLIGAIAQAQTEADLQHAVLEQMGEYFQAERRSLYFLDQLPILDENSPELMRRAISLDHNPVLRYLVQRHAVVHDEVVLPPGVWQTLCPRADHGHVMVGPIVTHGTLIGGVALTRHRGTPAFSADNVADLSALCLHFSTRLATLRSTSKRAKLNTERLTPREMEIAELVAKGLTNREIGEKLWITENSVKQALKRMFRKLNVVSRAEMVAILWRDRP